LAQKLKINAIDRIGEKIIFKIFPTSSADITRLTKLMERYSGTITPQGVMSLSVPARKETEIMDETISILKELS